MPKGACIHFWLYVVYAGAPSRLFMWVAAPHHGSSVLPLKKENNPYFDIIILMWEGRLRIYYVFT